MARKELFVRVHHTPKSAIGVRVIFAVKLREKKL